MKGEIEKMILKMSGGWGKSEILCIEMGVYWMLRREKIRKVKVWLCDRLVKDKGMRSGEIIGWDEFEEVWGWKVGKGCGGDIRGVKEKEKGWVSVRCGGMGGEVRGKGGGYMDDGFRGMVRVDEGEKGKEV